MKAALVLFILAIGAVCLNANYVSEDGENPNIEEGNGGNGNNRGGLVNGGDGGNGALSRQKRSSRRRRPISSSSSSSSSEEQPRHRNGGRDIIPYPPIRPRPRPTRPTRPNRYDVPKSVNGRTNGASRSGRQFFAPGVVPYGAVPGLGLGVGVGYAQPAPVVYG